MAMLDRLSSLLIALTCSAMAALVAIILGADWLSITLMLAAGFGGSFLLYVSAAQPIYEPTPTSLAAHATQAYRGPLLRHPDFAAWLDQEDEPILGISDNVVTIANDAALLLLGRHIVGADIRTAIRHPLAAEHFRKLTDPLADISAISLTDYPRAGQRWTMRLARLSGKDCIIFLSDRTEIDAADRMRSDFVANASHELRTPLAAILGYVETLQDMVPDDEPMQRRFLGIIEREGKRMQQLVLDLLSISRVEADRFRRPTTPVDLGQLVNSSIQHIQDSAESRPHDIKFDIMDAPMVLAGDAGQLSQLAFNVIGNAMKYGAAGTPIHIALKRDGSQAIFTVDDQSDGIPPEHLPRLTERFYRVDDARSRSVGGTGLGLSIVKHICERHQGQLQIESEVGRGTKVTIRFPLLPPSES